MEYVAIVTALALLQCLGFALAVGKARQTYNVPAPATTGHEVFERINRVHYNTLEQLILFIPGLWLFAYYVSPLIAAGIGVIFLIGRQLYSRLYTSDAEKRYPGVGLSILPNAILVIGGMIGALARLADKF